MQARFLLGPAGNGKTFRCLAEARQELLASADGPPLLFVTPKQTTYQVERRILADPNLEGYTRLHVLSFERFAGFIFELLSRPRPDVLGEEGRLMVLRALLAKHREKLKVFRASARLAGFSAQLRSVLQEFQRNQLTPAALKEIIGKVKNLEGLAWKIQDLATVLELYTKWLEEHGLKDADSLLSLAADELKRLPSNLDLFDAASRVRIARIWVDGFAEFSPQELEILTNLAPFCGSMTITFCLDRLPRQKSSWLSSKSVLESAFLNCRKRLAESPGVEISVALLERHAESRFQKSPALQHLEKNWDDPQPFPGPGTRLSPASAMAKARCPATSAVSETGAQVLRDESCANAVPPHPVPLSRGEDEQSQTPPLGGGVGSTESIFPVLPEGEGRGEGEGTEQICKHRDFETRRSSGTGAAEDIRAPLCIIACKDMEAEAVVAARDVLKHVRAGGRYRDIAVLVRKLHDYHAPLRRVFTRYEIPFFLDRRESVAHHPAVELTRSALRTVSLGWQNDDFFAALKTGLIPAKEEDIDRLENEALARGWHGAAWKTLTSSADEPDLRWLQPVLRRILSPFDGLALALASAGNKPDGVQLAAALRQFWNELDLEQRLADWTANGSADATAGAPGSVHATVWEGMSLLIENMELAFKGEPVSIRDWLSILEAAFASFSVGVIPPALDQVLIGTVDRSRDPDIQMAIVLGLNETIFPALPETGTLLNETDRAELERHNVLAAAAVRQQLSRERYYAYLACTRARQRLVLTFAAQDTQGKPLNPSPFLNHVQALFPEVATETALPESIANAPEHISELIAPLLKVQSLELADRVHGPVVPPLPEERDGVRANVLSTPNLQLMPALAKLLENLSQMRVASLESLSPAVAERLYGRVLRTSVSRIEQYAACPFKFFVHSGLRAQERKRFELDTREQGSFQHDALALFHSDLQQEGLRWRDLTPILARKRIGQIANTLLLTYRDGLFQASERSRFMGTILASWLQDFVETLVEWMREQYQFDPAAVELPFGEEGGLPAYGVELVEGRRLEFKGRIDRIDLWRRPDADEALCVVVDYKSSHKQLDSVLLENGLQLQLVTYLNVLRMLSGAKEFFGPKRLIPAGVFYVSLRGKYERSETRDEALQEIREDRKLAYRHTGRFDLQALPQLDSRPNTTKGDQFVYRLTSDGRAWKSSKEAMNSGDFVALLDSSESKLKQMGAEIFAGNARVFPYRKGSLTACIHCEYRAICRVDPWTQEYRVLK